MKIKMLILLNHIIFVYALTISNVNWLFLTLIMLWFIGKVGGEICLHRYLSHKSFEMPVWKYRITLILSIFNCFGSPIEWVGVHRKHHAFSDKEKDPHGYQSSWKIWTTFWEPFIIETKYVRDLMKDKWIVFIHKNYFSIIGIVFITLILIDWRLLAFGICGPSVLSFHQAGLINVITHKWGYRNFNTDDNSTNNVFANILSFGSGLHNNHHAYPRDYRNSKKPGEWDLPAWFIEKFLMTAKI